MLVIVFIAYPLEAYQIIYMDMWSRQLSCTLALYSNGGGLAGGHQIHYLAKLFRFFIVFRSKLCITIYANAITKAITNATAVARLKKS